MKGTILTLTVCIGLMAAGCQGQARRVGFSIYADQLLNTARVESGGVITESQLRKVAASLLLYLEGDAPPGTKLTWPLAPEEPESETPPQPKPNYETIKVGAAYGTPLFWVKAYMFTFHKHPGGRVTLENVTKIYGY